MKRTAALMLLVVSACGSSSNSPSTGSYTGSCTVTAPGVNPTTVPAALSVSGNTTFGYVIDITAPRAETFSIGSAVGGTFSGVVVPGGAYASGQFSGSSLSMTVRGTNEQDVYTVTHQ